MPNHWESSARPLFVRTIFVNGHRHAILFEEDPLLHYGNSALKRISRSNSSLSSVSDNSLTSSESQESNLDDRVSKVRNGEQRRGKDLSSDLQGCLIKLRLPSAKLDNGIKSDEEKCFCNPNNPERNQKEISKQKKYKWKREKNCRRKHCEYFQGESKENKLIGKSVNRSSSCYFYNYESNQRKKNYCVVKITSQSPRLTLSCKCNSNTSVTPNCKGFRLDNSKMAIGATIHNFFMTNRKERLLDSKVTNFFCENADSIDLYWNSYLMRSHYNSLSERVFQWLDLASKRKNQKGKLHATQEDDFLNSSERIFSGKTFLNESNKIEFSNKLVNEQSNTLLKNREIEQQEPFKEEVESGVFGNENTKSVSCCEKLQDDSQKNPEGEATTIPVKSSKAECEKESATISVPKETNPNPSSEFTLKSAAIPTKAPLKIQDLFLDYNSRGNFDISFGERQTRRIKGNSTFRSKRKQAKEPYSTEGEEEEEEEEKISFAPLNYWGRKTAQKTLQFNLSNEQTLCPCNGNFDGFADKINNQFLTKGFDERNQKSINNLNITRTQPDLIQNQLSPQQRDEITTLKAEKAVWALEKNTRRPQLHIFIPSLLPKDNSDDSLSECENVVNL